MKAGLMTSFLRSFHWGVLLSGLLLCSLPSSAEWGLDQVLRVHEFQAPEGLPEDTYFLEQHIRYLGPLVEGLAHGKGRLFWNNGQVLYEGGFARGLFEGNGIYHDRNGLRIYSGEFRQGFFHGTGTLFSKDGTRVIHEGVFKDGLVTQ